MLYLLDTNICIFVIKQKPAVVLARFQSHKTDDIGVSSITLAELRYGADKSARPDKNHVALDGFLAPLSIADFDRDAATQYGKLRADLERQGMPIGSLDTLIAAQALALDVTVVTNNVSEFARVPRLRIEDWTTP